MKLTQTAIRRPVTVSMFVVAITLFGLVSVDRLALNLLPDISYPSLTIQTYRCSWSRSPSSVWCQSTVWR